MENKHHIVWVEQPDTRKGWPEFREEAFWGALADAIDYIMALAEGTGFIVGQVLAQDGQILATVASSVNGRLNG